MDLQKPISEFSLQQVVELCKNVDDSVIPAEDKKYLDEEDFQVLIKAELDKYVDNPIAAINFLSLIKGKLNVYKADKEAQQMNVIVAAIGDAVTTSFLNSQSPTELKKRRIYAFELETGRPITFEHFGRTFEPANIIIKPFMVGKIIYWRRNWQTSRIKGFTLEMRNFVLEKELTPEQALDKFYELGVVKKANEHDFNTNKYKPVVIQGRIKGIYEIEKIRKDPASGKLVSRGENFNFIEPSMDETDQELVPVMKVDIESDLDLPIEYNINGFFRHAKLGVPLILLDDFMTFLKANVDTGNKKEVAQQLVSIFGSKDLVFVGVLKSIDPNYRSKSTGKLKYIFNLDLFTMMPDKESVTPVIAKPVETKQVKITAAPTEDFPEKTFIDDNYERLKNALPDKALLHSTLIAAVTNEYGAEKVNDSKIKEYIESL